MDVGIYVFPQDIMKETSEGVVKHLSGYSINQIHLSFNDNHLLENANEDLLYFEPDESYYQKENRLLKFSDEYSKLLQKFIKSAKKANFKIIAWINCLKNKTAVSNYPDWAQLNHKGEKSNQFLCPNNESVQTHISNLILNLIEKYGIDGIELFNARFPNPYKEELCCFCESCKKEAATPNSLEDLKEREIIDETIKGFDIRNVLKYFQKKSDLLESRTLEQDQVFQLWKKFRNNSITRFVGKILIVARQANKNISVGTDIWPISEANLVGQNHADLATYQDFIYQNLFLNVENGFNKHSKIIKETTELKKLIKKGRGLKKFYSSLNIDEPLEDNELKDLLKDLKNLHINGLVLYRFKRDNLGELEKIKSYGI